MTHRRIISSIWNHSNDVTCHDSGFMRPTRFRCSLYFRCLFPLYSVRKKLFWNSPSTLS
ncbi:hypothetical protein HMPREF3038_02181 [Akkermansia sp. KLE1797]|nr:hypothetical protein HMPREF3038_02181 [Akkermansia sp. KLE1797]KXU53484.1 hypothetical protein HMPREF3039_02204 [Akkermansia sp. KLE1798]KZA05679.1 hypothetical protein HMPREF1326_00503 [Akkermansia sp. KLE1605]